MGFRSSVGLRQGQWCAVKILCAAIPPLQGATPLPSAIRSNSVLRRDSASCACFLRGFTTGSLVAIRASIYHPLQDFAPHPNRVSRSRPSRVQLRNTQGSLFGGGDLLPHPRPAFCPRHCMTPLKGAQRVNAVASAWPEGRDVINS